MLHIRLRREGKQNQPVYRLVISEKTQDPWGDYIENLGTYNPRTTPSTVNFKIDRIKDWIAKGAQTSETVRNLLIDRKIITGRKASTIHISKTRREKLAAKAKENEKESAPAQAPAAPEAPAA